MICYVIFHCCYPICHCASRSSDNAAFLFTIDFAYVMRCLNSTLIASHPRTRNLFEMDLDLLVRLMKLPFG